MAKPKRSTHSGVHKNHGPKRHLFKDFKPMVWEFGKDGVLTKYTNEESFMLACYARGQKHVPNWLFAEMVALKTIKEKDEWFKNLSSRNLVKEDKAKQEAKKAKEQKEAEARRLKQGISRPVTNVQKA